MGLPQEPQKYCMRIKADTTIVSTGTREHLEELVKRTLFMGLPLAVSLSSNTLSSCFDPLVNWIESTGITALSEHSEPPARTQHCGRAKQ